MAGLNETNSTVQHSMGDYLSRHQVSLSVAFVASELVGLILCYNNLWHLRVATNTRYVHTVRSQRARRAAVWGGSSPNRQKNARFLLLLGARASDYLV